MDISEHDVLAYMSFPSQRRTKLHSTTRSPPPPGAPVVTNMRPVGFRDYVRANGFHMICLIAPHSGGPVNARPMP